MKPIRVALIEDRPEYSRALQMLIEGDPRFVFTAAFAKGEDAVKRLAYERPDVVLTDINLLGVMTGIEAMQILKNDNPKILFLMLTVLEDDDKIFSALEAGASGYLLKDAGYTKILEAIAELYNGGAPMSTGIARKVIESFRKTRHVQPVSSQDHNLTEREKEILEQLCTGKKLKEIGKDLFISIETVKTHCHNIYEKLHVKSRIEAIIKLNEG